MRAVSLPASWSAGRSMAALMAFSGYVAGAKPQIRLMQWELEKYGPAFHEPPSAVVIEEAMRFSELQFEPADQTDPRAMGRFHGSEIVSRRSRELLDLTASACMRIATHGSTPERAERMLEDVLRNALGAVGLVIDGHEYWFGRQDDPEEYAVADARPPIPSAEDLRRSTELLTRPAGWTEAHALSFLLHAAHLAGRDDEAPLPDLAYAEIRATAETIECPEPIEDIIARGESLFLRCAGRRFVWFRAIEDQLMHFVTGSRDLRVWLMRLVNSVVAAGPITPLRRGIVTVTMAVLAAGATPLDRPRQCPAWP